jgi:hypothetical protein
MTQPEALLESWRAASTHGGPGAAWGDADADQWWTPAVDALADALAGVSVDAISVCQTLGRQRAAAGVFLDSARRDVLNASIVAGCSPGTTASLLDALTLGWVDRTLDDYFTSGCVDPMTELTSLPYLMTRLAEIYAEADFAGSVPREEYALVVVQAAERSDPLEAETQMIAAQVAMRFAFQGGETLARIGPHSAVVLTRRTEPRFARSLRVLREELGVARAESRLPGVRIWIESLPVQRQDLPVLFREINSLGR